ncbi:methyl-accepting chemotaxis protein [Salmonella enterica subsp. enterica]|uniref:Methyl-accepting chemotaxis protein n=1 Tax=Salmonella enterica I TaxID=59201 RepID=A0A379WGU9_SALET|nr:methyl-accepting chemotaxis protein [Salmonella enterica subsp. enterica]
MRRYRRFAEKTISAIDALFQQPLDLQTLAGLPKALAAKMQELIDSLPGSANARRCRHAYRTRRIAV